jgi:Zn-dependent peptidase ImmA (M78 family)
VTRSEQRARAFAAELLMPAEGLRRLLGQPQYVMGMAEAMDLVERTRTEFLTPIEIAVNHLVNREYVWSEVREALIEKARRGESSGDRCATGPNEPSAKPDLLEQRVVEALNRDLITQGRARELLGLSAWDDLPARA